MHTSPIRFDRHFWICVAIGMPVLCAVIFTLAVAGWWVEGFPEAIAPRNWAIHPIMIFGLALLGSVATVLVLGFLGVVCWVAFAIGAQVIDLARRPRDGSRKFRGDEPK